MRTDNALSTHLEEKKRSERVTMTIVKPAGVCTCPMCLQHKEATGHDLIQNISMREITEYKPGAAVSIDDVVSGPVYEAQPLTRVNASYQSGNALVVDPLHEDLPVGIVIEIDNVKMWNRTADCSMTRLRQFVTTSKAGIGHTILFLYPSIWAIKDDPLRTVVDLPMNKAIVRRVTAAAIPLHDGGVK